MAYKFKNNWTDANVLKYRVFLSGFSFRSYEQSVIKINLERADVTSTGINILYSTKGSATIVDSFSVNLIIFDGYNPAFRYVEGVVSQTYLTAVMGIKIPNQGIS